MRGIRHIVKKDTQITIDIGLIEGYDSTAKTFSLHLFKTSRKAVCPIPAYMIGTITVGGSTVDRFTQSDIEGYIGAYAVVVNPTTTPIILSVFEGE
jgi:hypothetical protein